MELRNHTASLGEPTQIGQILRRESKYINQQDTSSCFKWGPVFRRHYTTMCAGHTFRKRFPITRWLPNYNWNFFICDLVAGLTVGITAIPKGIAYAVIAGLGPQYGLYSGFMGSFTYLFLGSTNAIVVGPTAIMSLMTQIHVRNFGADFAVLLTFMSGCIMLLFGIFQLGFLLDFISMPVTVGFTSAAAITIAASQLKHIFGLSSSSDKFIDSLVNFFEHIHEAKLWDSILGILTVVSLLLMQRLSVLQIKGNVQAASASRRRIVFGNAMWLISLARNAIVVFIGVGLSYVFYLNGYTPFALTGHVTQGFPPFSLPPFHTIYKNETMGFVAMTTKLGSSLIAIPLIAVLESISIAKAFSKGKAVDATQEMIALGISNIAGSFVRSMPVTGSFTHTAVNYASGVCTPAGGLYTGLLGLAALGLLTSTFYFLPTATLGGIIMTAMFSMIDYDVVPPLWRSKRLDLVVLATTFLFCLLIGLEYGMIVGIAVNLVILLYDTARPSVEVKWMFIEGSNMLVVTPAQSLAFPSAEYIREEIVKHCNEYGIKYTISAVVLDGSHFKNIDSTVVKGFKLLSQDLTDLKIPLYLWRWPPTVKGILLGIECKMECLFKDDSSLELILLGQQSTLGSNYTVLSEEAGDETENNNQRSSSIC